MNLIFPATPAPKDLMQSRLMKLAALFIFACSVVLMFSPAVRLHSWVGNYYWQQWVGFAVWLAGFSIVYRQVNRYLPDRDPYLLPIFALLSGWGLLEIFRLDPTLGFKQTAWLAVSLTAIVFGMRIPNLFNILRRYKYVWLISGLILGLLTFFLGKYPGGAGPRLWLQVGSLYLQPSEFLKILLVIYLSAYLADSLPAHFRLDQLLTPTFVLLGAALLILVAQRDLGTATLFILIYALVVYLASGKRRVLLFTFIVLVIALISGYLIFDVIRLRVDAWINPWLDPSGRSYQIVQSLQAVANGGLFGSGIGLGSPSVVPVAQSDFIFAAISEEFGMAGAFALVAILSVLTIRGLGIALHAPNKFQRFLAAGVVSYLITQSLLILGGTIRLLPLTGVTLPFLSYGGSSLITAFFSAFLLMLISNQAEDQPASIENAKSYIFIGSIFLAGFAMVGLFVGWWSMVRSDSLLNRTDNFRRVISDRYVLRGEILDRNDMILAQSFGTSGSYVRQITYPPLSATVGYSNPNYGQTGIEAAMDGYLRGIEGNQTTTIWINRELYSQYPPGLNIRLSLDLPLQKEADSLMAGKTGGLILMNSASGEIWALSTSPTFNANDLDAQWKSWMQESTAPLLNRVTQSQYPAGTALNPFILADYLNKYTLPKITPSDNWSLIPGSETSCAVMPSKGADWAELIASGCVEASTNLIQSITSKDLVALFNDLGFSSQPSIEIEKGTASPIPMLSDVSQYITSDKIRLSPLQMAVAAAQLTNGGSKITPTLVSAYQNSSGDWVLLQHTPPQKSTVNIDSADTVDMLLLGSDPVWQVAAQVKDKEKTVSWYIAGTPAKWEGAPFVLVVALEDSTALNAENIGQQLIQTSILQQ